MGTIDKKIPSILFLGILFFAPLGHGAPSICNTEGWTPNQQNLVCPDGTPNSCRPLIDALPTKNEEYKTVKRNGCDFINRGTTYLSQNDPGQGQSLNKLVQNNHVALTPIDELLKKNRELFNEINTQAIALAREIKGKRASATTIPPQTIQKLNDFEKAKTDPTALKTGGIRKPDITLSPRSPGLKPLEQATGFLQSLLAEREQLEKTKAELQSQISKATQGRGRLETPDSTDPTSPTSKGGSGFDPSSLMGLAGPAAMLASAFMQKQQPKDDSSVSQSPTPTPASPGPTKLDSLKTPTKAELPKEQKQTNPDPEGSGFFGGSPGGSGPDSEISSRKDLGNSGPAQTLGVSSATGGGSSSGNSGSSASNDRAPGSGKPNLLEDAPLSFSGSGGSSYSSGGSSGSESSSETKSDSPMAEVMEEIESALEGESTALFSDAQTQDALEELMTDELSIFPRVKKCVFRNLKKGGVLNGIGEKVPELKNQT